MAVNHVGFFSRPKTSKWFVRLFGPKISIDITADQFEFRGSTRVIAVRPVLFVRDGILVGVGSPPAEAAEQLSVLVSDPTERAERLDRLVKFGVQTLLGSDLTIRPVISVSLHASNVSFRELEAALLSAGAAIVTAT